VLISCNLSTRKYTGWWG